ncbi:MAG: class I SAM-dependent methyltransferase [Povalibacter sp.]
MSFKDHFSGHAALYARYRPDYPPELYEYLATLTPRHERALDCATGSGQAAVGLAKYFDRVVGTDGSVSQLQHALAHSHVSYVANMAEAPAFKPATFDLIVAAQAAHWFDHERFYAGARHILRPEGALAIWTYGLALVTPAIDAIILDFYENIVGGYWPIERRHVESGYRSLPFPFTEMSAPSFELRLQWDLESLLGYLATWSAVQRYIKARGTDPLPALRQRLLAHWSTPEDPRLIVWPLHLRVGRP